MSDFQQPQEKKTDKQVNDINRNDSQLHADASNRKHPQAPARGRKQLQYDADDSNFSQGTIVSPTAPTDDTYAFTIESAIAYAGKKGAVIPERTIYDNCQLGRRRNTLKCWQSSVGDGVLLIGHNSLDHFIQKRLEKEAFRGNKESIGEGGDPKSDKQDESGAHDSRKDSEAELVVEELKKELDGLRISNQAKDIVIADFKKSREADQKMMIEQSHRIGGLEAENKLLQLHAPAATSTDDGVGSEVIHHVTPEPNQTNIEEAINDAEEAKKPS